MGNAMADTIPNLWSDDIRVDVLTPLVILRSQASLLRQMTKGILEAEVTTATSDSGAVQHQLDLIAPALNRYRHRVLIAKHERDQVYPVIVEAECFQPKTASQRVALSMSTLGTGTPGDWRPKADTEQEFIDLVGKALHSGEVRSIIQSLIARSNEQRSPTAPTSSPQDDDAQG
jgi:hypothetical protein